MKTRGRNTTQEATAGFQVRESGVDYKSGRVDGKKYKDSKDS